VHCRELLGSRAPHLRVGHEPLAHERTGERRDRPTVRCPRERVREQVSRADGRGGHPNSPLCGESPSGLRAQRSGVKCSEPHEGSRDAIGPTRCARLSSSHRVSARSRGRSATGGVLGCHPRSSRASGPRSSECVSRGASRRGGENPRGRNERGSWSLLAEAERPSGGAAGVDSTSERPWRGTQRRRASGRDPDEGERA